MSFVVYMSKYHTEHKVRTIILFPDNEESATEKNRGPGEIVENHLNTGKNLSILYCATFVNKSIFIYYSALYWLIPQ